MIARLPNMAGYPASWMPAAWKRHWRIHGILQPTSRRMLPPWPPHMRTAWREATDLPTEINVPDGWLPDSFLPTTDLLCASIQRMLS